MASHNKSMQLIHVAKRNLSLDDETYRDIISNIGGAVSGSARDLNDQGVKAVLDHFKSLGWLPSKIGGKKLSGLSSHRPGMATQKQIRMLLSIWIDAARNPSEDAFNTFLNNQFQISHYRFLPQSKIPGVKLALESMKKYRMDKVANSE